MDHPTDPWERAYQDVETVRVQRSSEYEGATVANVREFISALRTQDRAAPEVSAGYWATFSLTFNATGADNLEIEVFSDHFEVYRFFDGRTDIREEPRKPGEAFPPTLMVEAPLNNSGRGG